ncbi:MAG: TonB-dependent receptor, partial [Lysobacterales bacterium]
DRDRASAIRRFQFLAAGPLANDPAVLGATGLDAIFNPANIGPNGFVLREVTRGTDNYLATQKLDAAFVAVDVAMGEHWRFALGARNEDNQQTVTTFSLDDSLPIVASLNVRDWLPALAVTWLRTDDSQWRFAYAETVSRPDFRELSPAPFTDPLLDSEAIGNPELVQTSIRNVDLRYEYFFSPTELFAASLFYKKFQDPIERITIPGTGDLLSFSNADSATNYGAEIEVFKYLDFMPDTWLGKRTGENFPWESFYIGANYAWVDSEVMLGESQSIQTNAVRPLQGQSRCLANLQLGYQSADGNREATLLFNRFGRRISQVGTSGAPDTYEEGVNQLDFVYSHSFAPDWAWKLRLRNLLDPRIEYTQGDETTREFKRGREVLVTLEWRPSFD